MVLNLKDFSLAWIPQFKKINFTKVCADHGADLQFSCEPSQAEDE